MRFNCSYFKKIIKGGLNSKEISLTTLGKAIVAPTDENEGKAAI